MCKSNCEKRVKDLRRNYKYSVRVRARVFYYDNSFHFRRISLQLQVCVHLERAFKRLDSFEKCAEKFAVCWTFVGRRAKEQSVLKQMTQLKKSHDFTRSSKDNYVVCNSAQQTILY